VIPRGQCQSCGKAIDYGVICGWCACDFNDAAEELERLRRGEIPTVDVAVENDDDWRSHVFASSRLPKFVQINPEGKSAAKYLRDGRRMKNPDMLALSVVDPFEDAGGDDNQPAMTLGEIGDELGISAGRVQQIEAKALRNMRHPSRSKRLRVFYESGCAA
jgi:hypothetical protein